MTIREYYQNYKINKKLGVVLPCDSADTIEDFYNKCISKNMLSKDNVLAWHDMFIEYSKREDAVFWVRYYESGNKKSGRWNTRRGCKTQFEDGFSYVFVSNFDAHEIFNMIRLGVKPDVDEFLNLMKNYEFPLHYDAGDSCEEKDMASFPKIGSTRAGVLTPDHWYLAHIVGIKEAYIDVDGTTLSVDVDKIYPRGEVADWKFGKNGKKIREIDYSLTVAEKRLVKAHFLRFVDPLNYYAAPGRDYQSNDLAYIIGEAQEVNRYMGEKYKDYYGDEKMLQFRKYALASCELKGDGDKIVNAIFGKRISGSTKSKIGGSVTPKKTIHLKKTIDLSAINNYAYLETFKPGEIAYQVLGAILNSGRVSKADVDAFKTDVATKAIFGFGKPLLSPIIVRTANINRYYTDKFMLYGETLYLYSQWLYSHKERLIKWIQNWLATNGGTI